MTKYIRQISCTLALFHAGNNSADPTVSTTRGRSLC